MDNAVSHANLKHLYQTDGWMDGWMDGCPFLLLFFFVCLFASFLLPFTVFLIEFTSPRPV